MCKVQPHRMGLNVPLVPLSWISWCPSQMLRKKARGKVLASNTLLQSAAQSLGLRYLVVPRQSECLSHKLVHESLWHLQSYSNNPTVYLPVAIAIIFFSQRRSSLMKCTWPEKTVIIAASLAMTCPKMQGKTLHISALPGSQQQEKQAGFSGPSLD